MICPGIFKVGNPEYVQGRSCAGWR